MFSWRNKKNINSFLLKSDFSGAMSVIRKLIALVKALFFNPKVLIFFLFVHENICCGTH